MSISKTAHIAELCSLKGVNNAIICPGSRSAPLTLAFVRNKNINCFAITDERSAAYIGMGIAQQTKLPVVLICTSGSATYNFAPAIAEACFQSIPLIVLTADRPNEWIGQMDGQAIYQNNIYTNHVKKFFELPIDYSNSDCKWFTNRIINEALNLATQEPCGPVHINVPLREPLYTTGEDLSTENVRVINHSDRKLYLSGNEWYSLCKSISSYNKILVVAGQNEPDLLLSKSIERVSTKLGWPVTGDILSNLHPITNFIRQSDAFLGQLTTSMHDQLLPDLVITFGKSLLSKKLKSFLKNETIHHWHIQPDGYVADTFQRLTKVIRINPIDFFSELYNLDITLKNTQKNYFNIWQTTELQTNQLQNKFFQSNKIGEFATVNELIKLLPKVCNLHLANSMPVRYANLISLSSNQTQVSVYSNRGTSGIDGGTSTAVGHALVSNVPNILITGDLAFFYDRNAFWHNYPLPNLFIIVLNNHGGLIFDLIEGSGNIPEKPEYFITDQKLTAKNLADEFGFSYFNNKEDMSNFFTPNGKVKILEIESTQKQSKTIFENFLLTLNKRHEQ